MRHRKVKLTLDRTASQRRRLLRNLAISVITHERIITTSARAKATRSFVERLITKSKAGTLASRRLLLQRLNNASAVDKLMTVLGPRYRQRRGGYTRLFNLTARSGDTAGRSVVELITS